MSHRLAYSVHVEFHTALTSEHFIPLPVRFGNLLNMSTDDYPTVFRGFGSEVPSSLELSSGTHFGYVLAGNLQIGSTLGDFHVLNSTYFSVPGPVTILAGPRSRGFVATRLDYAGSFQIGGQVSPGPGRISYIDNASTDLLIHPDEPTAPCLNKLYFPANQRQTPHTHPSFRMTCVIDGEGFCEVPDLAPVRVTRGDKFVIPVGGVHSINTDTRDLTLVTFHPESVGPGNPMLDSTITKTES